MPTIKSAIKQMRVSEKKRQRNIITKRAYRALVKSFLVLVDDKKLQEAANLLPEVQKSIDVAVKKNILHARTANRRKSHLALCVKGMDPKVTTATKSPEKKAPAKTTKPKASTAKPAPKKATAKKAPATKKAA